MDLSTMTKDECALLIYAESRAVDYGGRMNSEHLNDDDLVILDKWNESCFLVSGRIVSAHCSREGTLWVRFSEEAWALAHEERKARGGRMWENRTYKTTSEQRGESIPEPM